MAITIMQVTSIETHFKIFSWAYSNEKPACLGRFVVVCCYREFLSRCNPMNRPALIRAKNNQPQHAHYVLKRRPHLGNIEYVFHRYFINVCRKTFNVNSYPQSSYSHP